jgi:hypothetical protein
MIRWAGFIGDEVVLVDLDGQCQHFLVPRRAAWRAPGVRVRLFQRSEWSK